jgi:hypothetical protein
MDKFKEVLKLEIRTSPLNSAIVRRLHFCKMHNFNWDFHKLEITLHRRIARIAKSVIICYKYVTLKIVCTWNLANGDNISIAD